nr:MAG TPA: hypothetical protein [Caudoviricetes sp.]
MPETTRGRHDTLNTLLTRESGFTECAASGKLIGTSNLVSGSI